MRSSDFITEVRKRKPTELRPGDTTPHDLNPGWQELNYLRQQAHDFGQRLAGRHQLFAPRPNAAALSARHYRLQNLASPYAYDEKGDLKPEYSPREQPPRDLLPGTGPVDEAAPILKPGKPEQTTGWNKPMANLWTSTAWRVEQGWTSDWIKWASNNHPEWVPARGHLYRVKPGALVLELDSDDAALRIYDAYLGLGLVTEPIYDPYELSRSFPWRHLARHFDAVHHNNHYMGGGQFVYGWDCESTAWFDTDFLQLMREVDIVSGSEG